MIAGLKINLSLRVGRRRDDGYHELATVLVALPLGDGLELEPAPSTLVEAPGLAGGDGLVTRALRLLASRAGHAEGWRVRIEKRTPVGAGLGGGSADAGLALRLANATLREPLAPEALIALAAEVGSDVPFFAAGCAAALARGRGEQLEPCTVGGGGVWAVVAWPGIELSTAAVYARYRPAEGADGRVAALAAGPFAAAGAGELAALVENDLAVPAEQLCPPAAALRAGLLACGALTACVSGSGSAVFGLFAGAREAEQGRAGVAGDASWTALAPLPRGDAGARITV
jgi:4-diphosphocytidyl-2-C-methyl-D-erythritol kinase